MNQRQVLDLISEFAKDPHFIDSRVFFRAEGRPASINVETLLEAVNHMTIGSEMAIAEAKRLIEFQ